jgi:hypothetical protein
LPAVAGQVLTFQVAGFIEPQPRPIDRHQERAVFGVRTTHSSLPETERMGVPTEEPALADNQARNRPSDSHFQGGRQGGDSMGTTRE